MQSNHTGTAIDHIDESTILNCDSCGFVHVMPLPGEEELQKFYDKDFYDVERPDYFKYAEEDMQWWTATYNHYFDLFERNITGRRLLDIGSGPGYFLDTGASRGWETVGFEPSSSAVSYSRKRGLTVVHDIFSAEKAREYGLFDVVMISLVLEHVPDPMGFIEEAKKVLKPGGLVCVVVPNDYNPLQHILRAHAGYEPWWVVPKHHLNYFSVNSMRQLFQKLSLESVEIETTYPMEFFLLSGRAYVGNPEIGRQCHRERKKFELNLYKHDGNLLQEMYRSYAAQGIGREVVIIGKKV